LLKGTLAVLAGVMRNALGNWLLGMRIEWLACLPPLFVRSMSYGRLYFLKSGKELRS